MADEISAADDVQGGLTDAEKRDNVIRCAFDGDPSRYDAFVQAVRDVVPRAPRSSCAAAPSPAGDGTTVPRSTRTARAPATST